jgi:hypothetical protein
MILLNYFNKNLFSSDKKLNNELNISVDTQQMTIIYNGCRLVLLCLNLMVVIA